VGIDPDAIYLRDGSGLSPQNLVTPHALVQMLRHADAQPWREAFRSALAEPGEVESTLDRRLVNGAWRIQAKTGTIRHTNALSGYLRTPGGRELVFSILTNATGLPSRRVRAAMDRIIQTISDNWSQR
jgi:D-alanyl-D-alanine carboxypeptidase/D-alanyl-D-alanine-endopeptidase (penicillin-binding protein 4)